MCLFVLALQHIGGLSLVYSSSHPFTVALTAGVCFPCLRHPDVAVIVHVGATAHMTLSHHHSHSAQGVVTIYPLLLLLFGSFDGGSGQREREEGSEGKRKRVDRRDGEGAGVINRCVQEVSSSELTGCRGLL